MNFQLFDLSFNIINTILIQLTGQLIKSQPGFSYFERKRRIKGSLWSNTLFSAVIDSRCLGKKKKQDKYIAMIV